MFGKFKWLYNVVWGIIYLALGYIIYFEPPAMMRQPNMVQASKIITVLIVLMGLFRIYRGFKDFQQERNS